MAAFTPTSNPRPIVGVQEGPGEVALVATGGYTATASQEFIVGGPADAIEVAVAFVKTGAAPSVVFSVEWFDVAAQAWLSIGATAAVVATGTARLLIGAEVAPTANVAVQAVLRRLMRVTATHSNADVATYSVSLSKND